MSLLIEKLQRQSEYLDRLQERRVGIENVAGSSEKQIECQCDQWQTFPCDTSRKCETCHTFGICPDCAGCRTCWWEGVKAGKVPRVEVEKNSEYEPPF